MNNVGTDAGGDMEQAQIYSEILKIGLLALQQFN